jgi:hypothetical protein
MRAPVCIWVTVGTAAITVVIVITIIVIMTVRDVIVIMTVRDAAIAFTDPITISTVVPIAAALAAGLAAEFMSVCIEDTGHLRDLTCLAGAVLSVNTI